MLQNLMFLGAGVLIGFVATVTISAVIVGSRVNDDTKVFD